MTDETRETLACALAYCEQRASSETMWPSCNASDLHQWDDEDIVEWVESLARWGRRALALRDVLTPRTCGNCTHATDEHTRGTVEHGYVAVVCVKRGGYWRADDGCIRGWQAREGEGGTR